MVATPIFYINAAPHIGHLYTLALAEFVKRAHLANGCQTFLTTGTDEHGEKVVRAAAELRRRLEDHVDVQAQVFRDLVHRCHVDADYFIRTTDSAHKEQVNKIWDLLLSKGHIKKETYSGWYCVREESFMQERDLIQDAAGKLFTKDGDLVERVEELNYMLKAKEFIIDPAKFIEEQIVFPSKQKHRLNEDNIRDISISRPISRVHWGLRINSDPSCIAYVWFEALINYITLLKELRLMDNSWVMKQPTTVINVVGKDIIKFHSVMFPIIKNMAGLHFDQTVVCHEHWLRDGRKMSKSYGNVVDPFELLQGNHAIEKLKLYFLVYGPYSADADFSHEQMDALFGTFIDKIVNCYSRVFSHGFQKNVNYDHVNTDLSPELAKFVAEVSMNHRKFADSVSLETPPEYIWFNLVHYFEHVNGAITHFAPWTIKDPQYKSTVLSLLVSALQYPLPFLYLFVPSFYKDVTNALLLESPLGSKEHARVDDVMGDVDPENSFKRFWLQHLSRTRQVVDHGINNRSIFLRERKQ